MQVTNKWYAHTSKPVCKRENATVLWNQGLHTEKLRQKGK